MLCFTKRYLLLGLLFCVAGSLPVGARLPLQIHFETLNVMPVDAAQRIHVFFTGKVQGVGFRQTAKETANKLGLKGWIKNLPDARVEMVLEGPEGDLRLLMDRLREDFEIDDTEIRVEHHTGTFKSFEIIP